MSDLFIRNVDLDGEGVDIIIENGIIIEIGPKLSSSSKNIVEGSGLKAIPGMVDMQVHFREPGFEYKETIESGSNAALAGGFTQVAIMPNTRPTIDSIEMINRVRERIKASSKVDVHIVPAMTKSLEGKELCNFKEYKTKEIFAVTDDGIGVQSDEMMDLVFANAAKYKLSVLQHCEVNEISNGASIHDGKYAKENELKGIPSSSEWKMIERDISLLEKHGGHYHVLHVSSRKSLELVESAKKRGLNVTCEVTPHHLFLCDEDIKDSNFKMNPPLRSKDDMFALQEAFLNGVIDIVSTDHAPHSIEEKNQSLEEAPFGVIGLETAFPLLYSYFVKEGRCDLKHLVKTMSSKPCELFHLDGGEIKVGKRADITLIDDESVLKVDEKSIYSKSMNTPFVGRSLIGWPSMTIKEGVVSYER